MSSDSTATNRVTAADQWLPPGGSLHRPYTETLYYGDGALSAKIVMRIWAPVIPATRWSCSQQSLLSAGVD